MLDSESKFEKVQGIWFDDIDWGVDVSYDKVGDSDTAEDNCVYLLGGYAYGCKKVSGEVGKGENNNNQGTAFQRRIGKEKVKFNKNGWGLMIGKASFVMGLIEMVKEEGSGNFKDKWEKWFEGDNDGSGKCLEVIDNRKGREAEESYEYKPKKCKWKLKGDKKDKVISIFKNVFADEQGWAKKSFKKSELKGLCGGGSKWNGGSFGKNGESKVEEARNKFQKEVCENNKSEWGSGEDGHVKSWQVNSSFKVIEGQVFEFGGNGSSTELLAFEKEGEGKDVFRSEENGGGKISAGDWLKEARWGGTLGDQSCNSVEQWETRNVKGVDSGSNQCAENNGGEEGKKTKWLHDQNWEQIKKKLGLGKKSEKNKCQWLMREPFKVLEDPHVSSP
ncbi:hypothetical protein MSUIS_06500 [Mycoplasma suis KI3806]|uniref:Uncharacterized protein n=1 Tax=Mycoplasma suis (strain KI_3806) TaxID=708248 RepID=F0V262_MYCS3|nr:hypothetical protein [Mycoplasma suis]CBZ40743.1 hypothetical protein MSUIS_06500 [Mycoplasma suis KI3806]